MEILLNGIWRIKADPEDIGIKEGWFNPQKIDDTYQKLPETEVPGCWNTLKGYEKYEGILWYFKKFSIKPDPEKKYFLIFEGINNTISVWLNGHRIPLYYGRYPPSDKNIGARGLKEHPGPFLPLCGRIGEILKEENILAVRIDNIRKADRIPGKAFDWYNWGGIFRDVKIKIVPEIYIASPKVCVNKIMRNTAELEVHLRIISEPNDDNNKEISKISEIHWNLYYLGVIKYRPLLETDKSSEDITDDGGDEEDYPDEDRDFDILDELTSDKDTGAADITEYNTKGDDLLIKAAGVSNPVLINSGIEKIKCSDDKIFGCKFDLVIENPKLWSPQFPELYLLELSTAEGGQREYIRFGIREIKISGRRLLLNGKPLRIKGIALHEEKLPYGRSIPYNERRKDLENIKKMGFNTVRTGHYPHDESILYIADEIGLLIMEEIPVYWQLDYSNPRTLKNALNMLRTMIERDINHPSIIIWSVGNEVPIERRNCRYFIKTLIDYARKLDKTRPVTFVSLRLFYDPLRKYVDIVCVNMYFGWYLFSMKNLNFVLRAMTRYHRDKPWIITEFGAGARYGYFESREAEYIIKKLRREDPNISDKKMKKIGKKILRSRKRGKEILLRVRGIKYTEEYQASLLEHHIKTFNGMEKINGWIIWIYRDFMSHMRLNKYQQGFNRKGVIDEKDRRKFIALRLPYIINKQYPKLSRHILSSSILPILFRPAFILYAMIFGKLMPKFTDVGDRFYIKRPER